MIKSILSLAVVAMVASSAFAFGGGNCQGVSQNGGMKSERGMMMQGKGGSMMMLQMLDLSDEQRHQLAIIHSEMKLEMTKLRDPKNRAKMQEMMSGDSFDKKAFMKMSNEQHEKMSVLKANHMEKVFNLLSKEQRAELKGLMQKNPMSARGMKS